MGLILGDSIFGSFRGSGRASFYDGGGGWPRCCKMWASLQMRGFLQISGLFVGVPKTRSIAFPFGSENHPTQSESRIVSLRLQAEAVLWP